MNRRTQRVSHFPSNIYIRTGTNNKSLRKHDEQLRAKSIFHPINATDDRVNLFSQITNTNDSQ
jgi:hypothetical protein